MSNYTRRMIRKYQPGDHEAIAEIFTRAIHEIASEAYTPAQCLAWAARKPNAEFWATRCATKQPFVYIVNGRVAGFLELDPDGHIDCMYVHPEHARRGIASSLIDTAVEACKAMAVSKLYVEASHCARPVFAKKGFVVVADFEVEANGEKLPNFKMERELT